MICLAEKEDALEIAKIHKQEIGSGFLSSLPLAFLKKLYIFIIENDICVVDKEEGGVVGFISGTADIKKLYNKFLLDNFFQSVFLLLPKILDIRKIIESLFYPQKEELGAELLAIAVKRDSQGQGVAKKMFEFFIKETKKKKITAIKVLVGEKLQPAINFYEKSGFKFLKETTVHRGQKSKVYIYNL